MSSPTEDRAYEMWLEESDPDDPDYEGSNEDEDGVEEVEVGDDGDSSDDENAEADGENGGTDGEGDTDNEETTTNRRRKGKEKETESDAEEDIMERFEYEVEESVANWVDEFRIGRNSIPDSSDEEEDPIITRDRRIRRAVDDKLAIGRTFFTGFEFKEAVLDYALKTKQNIKQDRWEKSKLSFKCAQEDDCKWRVYCAYDEPKQMWVLKALNTYHKCTPNGKCKLLKSPVIGRMFMDKLRMNSKFMPLDIQVHIKEQWQLMSSIGQCQRGRLLALKWLESEYSQQFAHLRGYVAELKRSNPGSTALVETIPNAVGEDVFNRFYLCLGASKNAFCYCRPIIGIDGTFLKVAVKGVLLTAIGHDANNQIYPLAWAAVQSENSENWLWFLNQLRDDLGLKDGTGFVIISDRSKGIIYAVKNVVPNAEHRMCVKHIIENLKKKHANKDLLKPMVWHLAWSYNIAEFEANLSKMRAYNMSLYEDVMKEEPKTWSRAYYNLGSCCEDVDNNATESFNATIVKARAKALVPMLETIRRQSMARIAKRSQRIENWKKKITEYASDVLSLEKENALKCISIRGTHGQFEVMLHGNSHYVNLSLGKWECSCFKWQVTGIPCEHAYGAIIDVGKNVEDFLSPFWLTNVWREQYDQGPQPVRGQKFWMNNTYGLITAPPPPELPGRKKGQKKSYNRIKGKHESPKKKGQKDKHTMKLGRKGRTMHCSKCHESGHNAAGCKKFPKNKKKKSDLLTENASEVGVSTSNMPDTMTLTVGTQDTQGTQGSLSNVLV